MADMNQTAGLLGQQQSSPSFYDKLMGFINSDKGQALSSGLLASKSPTFSGAWGEATQQMLAQNKKEDPYKKALMQQQMLLNNQKMKQSEFDYSAKEREEQRKEKERAAYAQLFGIPYESTSSQNQATVAPAQQVSGQDYTMSQPSQADVGGITSEPYSMPQGGGQQPQTQQFQPQGDVQPQGQAPDLKGLYQNASKGKQALANAYLARGDYANAIKAIQPEKQDREKWGKPFAATDSRGNTVMVQSSDTGQIRPLQDFKPVEVTKAEEIAQEGMQSLRKNQDNMHSMMRPLAEVESLIDKGVKTGGLFEERLFLKNALNSVADAVDIKLDKTELTDMQMTNKFIQNAFSKFFAALDKKGLVNMNQKEFQQFRDAFLSGEMTPEAIKKSIQFFKDELAATDQYVRLQDEWAQRFGSFSAKDDRGRDFKAVWNNRRKLGNNSNG